MSLPSDTCRYTALHYKPNTAINIIVGAINVIWALLFCVHQYRWRGKGVAGWKWAWVLPFGCLLSGIGYFIRLIIDPCNFQIGPFIAQQMFIVLSPCFFIAFNYSLFGRFIVALDKPELSFINPIKVSKIFIWSDCITFWIQGSAGGLQAIQGSLQVWGSRLFLVGVALQALSFALFSSLVLVAHYRSRFQRKHQHLSSLSFKAIHHTNILLWSFHITNVFYLIRCVYRVLEFAFGNDSVLIKSEGWLIGLDAAPIILALATWIFQFPLQSIFEIAGDRDTLSSSSMSGIVLVSSGGLRQEGKLHSPDENV